MKIQFEATITSYAEGLIDVEPDEVAAYRSMTTDEQRKEWLHAIVAEEAYDEVSFSEIDTWHAFIAEDEAEEEQDPDPSGDTTGGER